MSKTYDFTKFARDAIPSSYRVRVFTREPDPNRPGWFRNAKLLKEFDVIASSVDDAKRVALKQVPIGNFVTVGGIGPLPFMPD